MTARLRLTLWYGALFLMSGALLLGLNYALVNRSFTSNPDEVRAAIANKLRVPPDQVSAVERNETAGTPDAAADRQLFRAVQNEIAHQHLADLFGESGIALAVMALASVGVGWLIAGRVLRPVHQMTATARTLSESNLHDRIALQGPADELKELADTFDAMLARLETAFDAQRRFVADASHELRTPLSIVRTEVDVALADPNATLEELRAMGETVRDATERSERLIESLLILARSDAAYLTTERCDLAEFTREALERLAPEADARELALDLSLEPAAVDGDRALLERLASNLVENAIRHNIDGGWITLTTSRDRDQVQLRVANGGTSLDAAQINILFDRFRRADDARDRGTPGVGLGLSIVESVVRAHHGTIQAERLPDGGLLMTVELPGSPRTNSDSEPTVVLPTASQR
jgi:signal transduction histidine kinase